MGVPYLLPVNPIVALPAGAGRADGAEGGGAGAGRRAVAGGAPARDQRPCALRGAVSRLACRGARLRQSPERRAVRDAAARDSAASLHGGLRSRAALAPARPRLRRRRAPARRARRPARGARPAVPREEGAARAAAQEAGPRAPSGSRREPVVPWASATAAATGAVTPLLPAARWRRGIRFSGLERGAARIDPRLSGRAAGARESRRGARLPRHADPGRGARRPRSRRSRTCPMPSSGTAWARGSCSSSCAGCAAAGGRCRSRSSSPARERRSCVSVDASQAEPTREELIAELRAREGTAGGRLDDPELLRVLLPLLEADTALYRSYAYVPEEPLAVPLRAYGGASDPHVTREDLEAWREQTTASFEARVLRGRPLLSAERSRRAAAGVEQRPRRRAREREAETALAGSARAARRTGRHRRRAGSSRSGPFRDGKTCPTW